ncbi:histidinol dehydrogenase [Enterococcus saccharolyticus]|uniref:histidinol dehydrogenase n=1 Tax=Enterococcus saccharolyticus TaxID=41997 RepID=UPI001E57CBFE|nr:histidinol dehydrogenase [Enterococcus saccharolyticus]MCD5002693.1 histidinol dehydrogenase [Enterococcus saccharolyticus]
MTIRRTSEESITALTSREVESQDVTEVVAEILADVKQNGDEAIRAYTKKFDGAKLAELRVSEAEISSAIQETTPEFLAVLEQAKQNIQQFHEKQVQRGFITTDEQGTVMGQRVIPLEKVGVYVPGGTAAYPSTVLMDVLPAKIAGVSKIVMITPPNAEGKIPTAILAAAKIAGVDEIYKVGGAQGVAALAYGTESLPKVDKIVGPGNIFVATAKRMVYGLVDIDMIAGPSDVLIVADESANPRWLAADLLAQAEHDALAQAILVTTNEELAQAVQVELQAQLDALPRKEIAQQSIDNNGKLIVAKDIEEALAIANQVAPEHLELCVAEPFSLLGKVKHAGSVFLGHYTPEVLGDYFAGPNHTLPTEGTARFSSPLSVDDFIKKSSYLYYSKEALHTVANQVIDFAEMEGLSGHARSMRVRKEEL